MLQPVGVFAVTAILRPARRLDVGGAPRQRPERPQGGGRMKGSCTDLEVIGLQNDAALPCPIMLQR